MRIAYLSADHGVPVLGGKGASVHVQQLISGLAALGHEVVLYCTRLGDGDPGRIAARIVDVVKPAQQDGDGHRLAEGNVPSRERLSKERGWMGRAAALEARVLADHANRPFDMIYERYSLWSRAGVAIARRTGLPCVVEINAPLLTEAEAYREIAAKSEASAIEADVFRHADALVAVSDAVANYVVANGAQPARVHVVPNGVDPLVFYPDIPATEIPGIGSGPVIGFVGGLKPWHGLQELLGAFRIVSDTHSEARLLIVGDGPMRGWIDGFLAGTGLADRVVMPGWVSHDALPGILNRMTIATAPYPKLDDFYFSPLKLFEYMSAGRAIVASAIGQIDGIIHHGHSGLLAAPGLVEDLAGCIRRLLDDQELRVRLGQNARAGSRQYTWLGNARRVAELGTVRNNGAVAAPIAVGAGE